MKLIYLFLFSLALVGMHVVVAQSPGAAAASPTTPTTPTVDPIWSDYARRARQLYLKALTDYYRAHPDRLRLDLALERSYDAAPWVEWNLDPLSGMIDVRFGTADRDDDDHHSQADDTTPTATDTDTDTATATDTDTDTDTVADQTMETSQSIDDMETAQDATVNEFEAQQRGGRGGFGGFRGGRGFGGRGFGGRGFGGGGFGGYRGGFRGFGGRGGGFGYGGGFGGRGGYGGYGMGGFGGI